MNTKPIEIKFKLTLPKEYVSWAKNVLTPGWNCVGARLYATPDEVIKATEDAREKYEHIPSSYIAVGTFKDAYLMLTPDGDLWRLGSRFRSLNAKFGSVAKTLK